MEKNFIQSLEKGLTVIRAFNADNPSYTLAEIARETGLSRASARRIVLTLQALGYVGTTGRTYHLLPKVLELGYAYLSSFGLTGIAQPHLDRLNTEVQEGCSLGVLSEGDVVYIARAQSRRIMSMYFSIGARLDAAATAIGRVLLSGLSDEELEKYFAAYPPKKHTPLTVTSVPELIEAIRQIRAQGWGVVDQELEIGFRTAAAPIRNREGKIVAAINVGAHASRISQEEMVSKIVPQVLETARAIETDFHRTAAS